MRCDRLEIIVARRVGNCLLQAVMAIYEQTRGEDPSRKQLPTRLATSIAGRSHLACIK